MTWVEHAQNIYTYFNNNGYKLVVDGLVNKYGIGGTPGEQLMIVCRWLAGIKNHQPKLYALIEQDAEPILKKGIAINYFTKSDYDRL